MILKRVMQNGIVDRVLGGVLGFAGADMPRSGTVVGKNKYRADDYPGNQPPMGSADAYYSLMIHGKDRFGREVTHETYVDEMVYNNTELGASWPPKHG